jgi:putative phage-type endonuclease
MIIRTDITQGSDEWHNLRLGKITGSSFDKLLGTKSAKDKYCYDKANEIVTRSLPDAASFNNIHMQRGNNFENVARTRYLLETFSVVKEVGIVILDDYLACSPDGLIDDDGLIEIKVPDSNNYFRQVLQISTQGTSAIPNEYYIQMQFNMYVCGRNWCDYVLYNPQHAINNLEIFIYRIPRDDEMQKKIGLVLDESIVTIKQYVNQYFTLCGRGVDVLT